MARAGADVHYPRKSAGGPLRRFHKSARVRTSSERTRPPGLNKQRLTVPDFGAPPLSAISALARARG